MNLPTLNVVMAFDYSVIEILKSSQSLDVLADKTQDNSNVLLFRNGPTSNFLSLSHSLAWGGGSTTGTSTRLEIEFLDPESTFEESLMRNDLDSHMPPQANLATAELERLKKSLEERKSDLGEAKRELAKRKDNKNSAYGKENKVSHADYWRKLNRVLQVNERLFADADARLVKFKADVDAMGGILQYNKFKLLEIQAATKSLTQRPVWITYGAGEDFKNWSPVLCFQNAIEMGYIWTGTGVRKLKIVYDGVGISPHLTAIGVSPLGALGLGMVMKGQSSRLFNKESNEKQKSEYKKVSGAHSAEVDKLFNLYRPSIHKIITDIFKDYIIRGTGYENVVVAFPDLDTLLETAYRSNLQRALHSIATPTIASSMALGQPIFQRSVAGGGLSKIDTSDTEHGFIWDRMAVEIAGFRELVETFGFSFVEAVEGGEICVDNSDLRLQECDKPEQVEEYFNKRIYKTVLVSDGYTDTFAKNKFMSPLVRSIEKIVKQIIDDGGFDLGWTFRTEHDYETLKLMAKHHMIPDGTKPALIFGSSYFINSWIYGHRNTQVSTGGSKKENPLTKVNVRDKIFGFNPEYTTAIKKILQPPTHTTPFGPMGDAQMDDYSLKKDTNISMDSIKTLSEDEKLNLIIFTLGTKNTNVVDINFNLNNQYLSLINSFTYKTMTASQFINGIIPKGKVKSCTGILGDLHKYQLGWKKGDAIPDGFKKLIAPWLIEENLSDSQVQWGKVFEALGIPAQTALEKVAYPDIPMMRSAGARMMGMGAQPSDFAWVVPISSTTARRAAFRDPKTGKPLTVQQIEDYKILYYWNRFKALTLAFPKPVMTMGGTNPTQNTINHANLVADKMVSYGFTGSLKTLPMFHLSNGVRVQGRNALLYCVEPRITGISDSEVKYAHTWFSGMYQLLAFKHHMSGGSAYSEFKFVRAPGRSMTLKKGDK